MGVYKFFLIAIMKHNNDTMDVHGFYLRLFISGFRLVTKSDHKTGLQGKKQIYNSLENANGY